MIQYFNYIKLDLQREKNFIRSKSVNIAIAKTILSQPTCIFYPFYGGNYRCLNCGYSIVSNTEIMNRNDMCSGHILGHIGGYRAKNVMDFLTNTNLKNNEYLTNWKFNMEYLWRWSTEYKDLFLLFFKNLIKFICC
eukprot:262396_1